VQQLARHTIGNGQIQWPRCKKIALDENNSYTRDIYANADCPKPQWYWHNQNIRNNFSAIFIQGTAIEGIYDAIIVPVFSTKIANTVIIQVPARLSVHAIDAVSAIYAVNAIGAGNSRRPLLTRVTLVTLVTFFSRVAFISLRSLRTDSTFQAVEFRL